VVRDAHLLSVIEEPSLTLYSPLMAPREGIRTTSTPNVLVARARPGAETEAEQAIRRELRAALPGVERIDVRPMKAALAPQLHPWRLGAALFSVLGMLALAIAALGVYSVVAYDVSQRGREIGVRVAIGATRNDILWLVLDGGLRGVLLGACCGVVAVALFGRAAAPLLYQTAPEDPAVILAAASVLLCAAIAACLVPGARALRVDPLEVMRAE
jgi:cell division protein FtsX